MRFTIVRSMARSSPLPFNNRRVLANRSQQFQRDLLLRFIAQDLNGAVRLHGIMEREFFFGKSQLCAPLVGLSHIFWQGRVKPFGNATLRGGIAAPRGWIIFL